jgi:hypothetical protein
VKNPLCEICYRGNQDGLQLAQVGIRDGKPVYRCGRHVRSAYEPPIDVEVTMILDIVPSVEPPKPQKENT